jgi:hypothetical protein
MSIALLVSVGAGEDHLDDYLRFHRAAGIDVVVLGGTFPSQSAALEQQTQDGFVRQVEGSATPTDLARVAADELGADWVIPATPDELWWPRGESLQDVLAIIPPRYGVVQGLVREFLGADELAVSAASPFLARTVRSSLLGPDGAGGASLERLLRPIFRAGPNMTLDARDWTLGGRLIPMRAWYPIEVFDYSMGTLDQERIDAGLADGTYVVDTRPQDALTAGISSFPVPSIVDDSSYAVECAAVGEVDLVKLDRQIRELESRIAALEARLWPTVRRTLRRIARRPG